MLSATILLLMLSPFLAILGAGLMALILFWPVMVTLGALHGWIDWVPALGWEPVFLFILLINLLFPSIRTTQGSG